MSDQFLRYFINKLGKEVGLPPALLSAIPRIEAGPGKPGSGLPFNPNAKNPKSGATGAMQLMPGTAEAYGVKDRTNPYESLEAGAKYLRDLGGNLAAYNAGPTRVRQAEKTGKKLPKETRDYVQKVGITETMEKPKMHPPEIQEYYKYLPGTEKNPNGLRPDGTPKGKGYFGELPGRLPGTVSTELTVGIDGQNLPSIVPTLTPAEMDYVLAGGDVGKEPGIISKIVGHAKSREKQGKSPYAQEGEQKPYAPPMPARDRPVLERLENFIKDILISPPPMDSVALPFGTTTEMLGMETRGEGGPVSGPTRSKLHISGPAAESFSQQLKDDIETLRNFSLYKMLTPEFSESYRGKEIRFPNLGMGLKALGSALNLADPTGMVGGPAGFIFEAKSPAIGKTLVDKLTDYGTYLERRFPRMEAATKKTPVHLYEQLPGDEFGEAGKLTVGRYITRSPQNREGLIELKTWPKTNEAKLLDLTFDNLTHEGVHRLQELDYPAGELSKILWNNARSDVQDAFGHRWSRYNDYLAKTGLGEEAIENIMEELLSKEYMAELAAKPWAYRPASHAEVVQKYLQDMGGVEPLYKGRTLFMEPFGLDDLLKSHGIKKEGKSYADLLQEAFSSKNPDAGKEALKKMGLGK